MKEIEKFERVSSRLPPERLHVILTVTERAQDDETGATTYDGLWKITNIAMKEDAC